MNRYVILWTVIFLVVISLMCIIDISNYIPSAYAVFDKNRPLVISGISIIFIAVFTWLMVALYLLKKYSLKVEKLSFGGINVLFNESSTIYTKSIKNHLDSKRAIFKLKNDVDAFDEVISSYYQTYQYIRDEMKILHPKKDRELYNISNNMLKVLNDFLTNYQNNYKRWYKYVSENDEVKEKSSGAVMCFHETSINKIQEQYYDYQKILDGFKEVNKFFAGKIKRRFCIDTEKWR